MFMRPFHSFSTTFAASENDLSPISLKIVNNSGRLKKMIGLITPSENTEHFTCLSLSKRGFLSNVTLGIKKGEVGVWSLTSDKHSSIQAHENNIVALAINNDGSLIATASESGTNIKVYSTESGNLLYQLRRGTSSAEIYDMCFDNYSKQLACISNKGTVHIWDLTQNDDSTTNKKSMLSPIGGVVSYFDSVWSREKITLGDTSRMICSFDDDDTLHVATYDGNYFKISGTDGKYDQVKRTALYINQK